MFNGRTILDNVISAAIGILIIAYFYSRLAAPTPTEIATIQHPHELGFPKWFGSGPSPHDVRIRHVANGFEKILVEYDGNYGNDFAFPLIRYLKALSTSYQPLTIQARGKSLDRYAPEVSSSSEGKCSWDWIWAIGREPQTSDLSGCSTVVVYQPDGVFAENIGQLDISAGVTVLDSSLYNQKDVAAVLYSDLTSTYRTDEHQKVGLIAFALPAANPDVFYPKRHLLATLRKQVGEATMVFRQLDLRKRFHTEILQSVQPSRDLKSEKTKAKEEDNLARQMRGSGICVFDDWETGVLNELMAQAMLSGCVVAAAPQKLLSDELHKLFIPLGQARTPEESLFTTVDRALSAYTHAELDRKALWGFIYAREKLTFAKRLHDVDGWVRGYLEGQRGVLMPFGFNHEI